MDGPSPQMGLPVRDNVSTSPPCFACQRRHSRCDRALPACEACQSRGTGSLCSYQVVDKDMASEKETSQKPDVPRVPVERVPVERAPLERAPLERAPLERAPLERAPAEEQEQDIRSPVAKRIKLSNSTAKELAGSVERSSDVPGERKESQTLINASNTVREASLRGSPDKRKRFEVTVESAGDAEALRKKWAQELIEIQAKDPNQGSGSFSWIKLAELARVLRLSHPHFTKDEDDERKELLNMIQRRLAASNPGSLGWADLSSLRLICIIPEAPDRIMREELENDACLVDLEASARGTRPFPATAVRRLKRVFQRVDPDYQQSSLYHEVKSALEGKDMIARSFLEKRLVRRCLNHLFPSVEDVQQGKTSNSAKKPSTQDPKIRPAKAAAPKEQVVASKNHPVAATATAHGQASSSTQEQRSARSTAPLALRSTRMALLDIEDSDVLLKTFITLHYSILPIFHLPDLELLYRTVRTSDIVRASELAIINFCFALVFLGHGDRTTQQAIDFYHCGTSSLPLAKESGDTLPLIQAHILQAQYLFETGDLDEASVAIGSAIRRAHCEGIHMKAGAYHPIRGDDLQLRRKIWHAIQVLERTLALYRGVAPPDFTSDCNAAFPGAPLTSTNDQLIAQTQRIGFVAFNAWARLYQPVEKLMDIEREFRIYEPGCQMHKIACNFKDYYEEHARLQEWTRSLSEPLEHVPDDSGDVSRLRIVINLRYFYYRLRLHRPFLILALSLSLKCTECQYRPQHLSDDSLEAPLEFGTIRDGFSRCLKAAFKLYEYLLKYTREGRASHYFRSASLAEHAEFAYACGLVFLAVRMVPDLAVSGSGITSIDTVQSGLACILTLLRMYEKVGRHNELLSTRISRCADALDALSKAVGVKGPFRFITEGEGLPMKSWQKLYGRLQVDMPIRQFVPANADSSMSFGWIESLAVDLDD